jgi:hypothetical protein
MRVDLSRLVGLDNHRKINVALDSIISESIAKDDPIFFSDLLVNWQDSYILVSALMEDEEAKYKLLVLCNEWGEKVYPGDKVRRKHKRPLVRDGVPTPAKTLNQWKAQGIYDQKRYTYTTYLVDEKGCITVSAEDCEYFLRRWGIHSISGHRLSVYTEKTSGDKAKDPVTGEKKFVHYWRYKEMTPEMYADLPKLPTRAQDTKQPATQGTPKA